MNENIRGSGGYVNLTGSYGSSSAMTTNDDINFWEYIEDGIKPLVEVFVKYKIRTFGSCQGHCEQDKPDLYAHVCYYTESNTASKSVKKAVKIFNDSRVIWEIPPDASNDVQELRRAWVVFQVSPSNRKELQELIDKYSLFLDMILNAISY